MLMKVSDLTGAALDYAVALAEGCVYGLPGTIHAFSPSTKWSQGGPIIEREKINTHSNTTRMAKYPDSDWLADCPEHRQCVSFTGQTPLIAAMRCFVASKLGDEIEVPDEL